MPKSQKISVIVPVYNRAQYLRNCLDSILFGTYSDIELICVNDGSTDNSLSILKDYQKQDSRVIVLDKPNGGVSSARNLALDCVSGDWIAFVDSDDAVQNHFFEYLIQAVNSCETEPDMVACGYYWHEGAILPDVRKVFVDKNTIRILSWDDVVQKPQICLFGCGKLFNRKLIGDTRFRETLKLGEDTNFVMDVLGQAEELKLAEATAATYLYRNTPGSATHNNGNPALKKCFSVLMEKISHFRSSEMRAAVCEIVSSYFCVISRDYRDVDRIQYADTLRLLASSLAIWRENGFISSRNRRKYITLSFYQKFPLIHSLIVAVKNKLRRKV